MSPDLIASLVMVTRVMGEMQDEWWIIGSAAVALHGADPGPVADIDILLSERDASQLFPQLGIPIAPGGAHHQFASTVFGIWNDPPISVEFMAGLRVMRDSRMQDLQLHTRTPVTAGTVLVYVPTRPELEGMLRLFDRPKDAARLGALRLLD
ncbi:hypothetical protein GCM10022213_09500 [Parerythrobacter jejuensis]